MEGWIVKPKNLDPEKKYPVLFYFYSEPAGQTGVNRYGAGRNGLYDGDLGEDGYVYVTFDGRGTPSPKGRAWRKAIYRNIGRINVRDMAMGAKAVFSKYDFIDTSRVAVHGWSGGGTATLNCLFQYPEIFHTGIAAAAVANQLTYDNIYQERYMGDPKESYQDYIDGSPIKYAKNLKGNFVTPGFIDNHVHFISGGLQLSRVNLNDVSSKQEFQARIIEFDRALPKSSWILGGNWDHELWGGIYPDKSWIDEVVSDRPVFLDRLDGHMGLANTKAMTLAGIHSSTLDPPGGVIVRDQNSKLVF